MNKVIPNRRYPQTTDKLAEKTDKSTCRYNTQGKTYTQRAKGAQNKGAASCPGKLGRPHGACGVCLWVDAETPVNER